AEVQSRDDRQSSERADQEFVQVVAGDIFHDAAAALRNDSLACNKLSTEQKILRRAMSISHWRVCGCGDDSTKRGALRKRRRERQELPLFAGVAIELSVGYARLNAQREIVRLVGYHAVQCRNIERKIVSVWRHADVQVGSA